LIFDPEKREAEEARAEEETERKKEKEKKKKEDAEAEIEEAEGGEVAEIKAAEEPTDEQMPEAEIAGVVGE